MAKPRYELTSSSQRTRQPIATALAARSTGVDRWILPRWSSYRLKTALQRISDRSFRRRWFQSSKSKVYADFCGGLARQGICATAYCTIAVGQTRLLDRIKDRPVREWYLKAAVEHGWSQNVLVHHISSGLHQRQRKALTNFPGTLHPEGSDLAEQILKDPYQFDFLTLTSSAKERELERGLLAHLRDLLLELGRGFAFVGSQVPLEIDGQTYYVVSGRQSVLD